MLTRLQNSRFWTLPILPRRFHTRSRPPCIRILTVARVRKKYDCFAVYMFTTFLEHVFGVLYSDKTHFATWEGIAYEEL